MISTQFYNNGLIRLHTKLAFEHDKPDYHVLIELRPRGERSLRGAARRGQYSGDMDSFTDPVAIWDQATLTFYGHEAPAYVAKSQVGASRWLADFMRALPPGARILELGRGSGRDAEALLARGFDVDATDGTPTMAAEAEQRLGRPVRIMRFDELSAVDTYDGIWANASLLHVPRAALSGILALVLRALKPGGLHFSSYKAGVKNL